MLKGVLSLIFISLLFCNSNSQLHGLELVGPISKTAIQCLATDPITPIRFLVVRIYKISGTRGIDQGGVQIIALQGKAIFFTFTYVQVCRSDPPETITNAIIQQYPVFAPLGGIFVKVQPNNVTGCTWTGYTHQQNCDYLTAVLDSLYKAFMVTRQASISVYSTATSWKLLLGNTCKGLQNPYTAVWYANYNNRSKVNTDLNGNDFIPFGGWFKGSLKTVSNSVHITLCNNPSFRTFGNRLLTAF